MFTSFITQQFKINNQIKAAQVRVIDEKGEHVGVMNLSDALDISLKKGLDVIEIQPHAKPPVVKISDWAKFLYHQKKTLRKQGVQKAGKIKGIRFGLKIFEHDLEIKAARARGFLDKNFKVRVQIPLRRYERDLQNVIKEKIKVFLLKVEVPVAFDQAPQKSPQGYTFIIRKSHPIPKKDHGKEENKDTQKSENQQITGKAV